MHSPAAKPNRNPKPAAGNAAAAARQQKTQSKSTRPQIRPSGQNFQEQAARAQLPRTNLLQAIMMQPPPLVSRRLKYKSTQAENKTKPSISSSKIKAFASKNADRAAALHSPAGKSKRNIKTAAGNAAAASRQPKTHFQINPGCKLRQAGKSPMVSTSLIDTFWAQHPGIRAPIATSITTSTCARRTRVGG